MTRHQARRERREAERKAKKAEIKRNRALEQSLPHLPPEEEEFSAKLIAQANAARERVHRKIDLNPEIGFVSQRTAEPSKRAEINRANAQHSTGPRSPQGKATSSRNSLKHGLASGEIIIPGEDPAAFDALLHDLLEEHQPASPTEELLIKEMAQSYWLAQRALRFQNECFTETGVDEKRLALFLRYQTTHDRAFHKALSTLMKLQKSQKRERPSRGFVSHPDVESVHRGFVSQPAPSEWNPQPEQPAEYQRTGQHMTEAA
ncbi:MAG: hypothetical protein JOZ48_22435 [Acidobacteriaceae bacterium]|nr:hypothetical protein [Acidobacteriaceae bacterium]